MSKIDAYLFFDGNCAEAMHFYERVLGGTARLVTAKDTPGVPPGMEDKIMHAHLDAGKAVLMASDWMDTSPFPGMKGFSVCLSAPAGESKRLFEQLGEGGKVTAPFEKTFFSEGFGMLVDRFGVPWMVITESEHPGS